MRAPSSEDLDPYPATAAPPQIHSTIVDYLGPTGIGGIRVYTFVDLVAHLIALPAEFRSWWTVGGFVRPGFVLSGA